MLQLLNRCDRWGSMQYWQTRRPKDHGSLLCSRKCRRGTRDIWVNCVHRSGLACLVISKQLAIEPQARPTISNYKYQPSLSTIIKTIIINHSLSPSLTQQHNWQKPANHMVETVGDRQWGTPNLLLFPEAIGALDAQLFLLFGWVAALRCLIQMMCHEPWWTPNRSVVCRGIQKTKCGSSLDWIHQRWSITIGLLGLLRLTLHP